VAESEGKRAEVKADAGAEAAGEKPPDPQRRLTRSGQVPTPRTKVRWSARSVAEHSAAAPAMVLLLTLRRLASAVALDLLDADSGRTTGSRASCADFARHLLQVARKRAGTKQEAPLSKASRSGIEDGNSPLLSVTADGGGQSIAQDAPAGCDSNLYRRPSSTDRRTADVRERIRS